MTNVTHNTLSIGQFAAMVARNDRELGTACKPFQTCYAKADDAGKKQLLGDWKDGYVRETFSLGDDFTASKGKAMQELTAAKRIDWALYVAAIDRANSQFGYYVSGTAGKGKAVAPSDEIAVPKHIAALAAQLATACQEYEGARKLATTAVANAFAK